MTNNDIPPEKVSIKDIVNNTPKGNAAIQRALEGATKDQAALSAKANEPIENFEQFSNPEKQDNSNVKRRHQND